jgi:hypothetical protein
MTYRLTVVDNTTTLAITESPVLITEQVAGISGPKGDTGDRGSNGQGFNYRNAWVINTSYLPYDVVVYSGSTYVCILAVSGSTIPSADPTHWTLTASKGDTGATGGDSTAAASDWVSGRTYAKGDYVLYGLIYYIRRNDGSGTTTPNNDASNWSQRSPMAETNGSSLADSFVGYNINGGIYAQGLGVGGAGGSAPNTGLSVNNGSLTITGVGNGINVSSNGNLTLGASGNNGGSIAITNTTGIQLIKGSSGTSNHTLPTTGGTFLNDATTSLPNVTSVNSTTIPASSTLLTSVSALDGGNLTASTVTSAKLASVTGTGTVVVTDTNPTLTNPIKSGTQYNLRAVPTAVTTTITATQLLGEWVTSGPSSAQNTSLPAFSSLNATGVWLGGVNGCVDWSYINTGTGTVTITSGTSHTVQSGNNATVAGGTSARFSTRLAANGLSFITYRLS